MQSAVVAISLVGVCTVAAGGAPSGNYTPPSPPPGSECYQLVLADWEPAVTPREIAWIMPPAAVALTPLAVDDSSSGAHRLLPDMDPASNGKKMPFAQWNRKDGGIEIVWTNGFAGMLMRLSPNGDSLRGSGHTVSDDLHEASKRFKVRAERVDCRQLRRAKSAVQQ